MKKLLCLALALMMVLSLAACGGGNGGSSYESAVDAYMDYVQGKWTEKQYEKSLPEAYWEVYDFDSEWEDYEYYAEMMQEQLEDTYGKNIKITYRIVDEDKWSKRDLEDYAEELGYTFDIDPDDVTAGYDLELELTIKGSEDKRESESELSVVQIEGKWYVTNLLYGDVY